MDRKAKDKISKFLSFVLRHSPETIGLQLDENGWADVEELIRKSAEKDMAFSNQELEEVVTTNDKQRFSYSEDKRGIRASQGHSIDVELQLEASVPPEMLYHGTVDKFLQNIMNEGLRKMDRHHVHLSQDIETAEKVGSRRGVAVILVVRSGEMGRNGFKFYFSANGVWLTDQVPAKYIDFETKK
jgi:putative RNA 2'-phosphotransferase